MHAYLLSRGHAHACVLSEEHAHVLSGEHAHACASAERGARMHAQMGHLKTVLILAGGFVLFKEELPPVKLAGVVCALAGIIWYSGLKMKRAGPGAGAAAASNGPTEKEPLLASAKP